MLSKASIEAGSAPFVEIQNIIRNAVGQHILRADLPTELISKMMGAVAEATMDLIVSKPAMAKKYREGGFAFVTGANSGIRWHTLRELARAGSEVIVAARSEAKGRDAVERVRRELPSAQVHFETLDLADLPSMRAFADTGGKGRPHSVGGFEETHGHCFRGFFS
jgi:hypothetical protein